MLLSGRLCTKPFGNSRIVKGGPAAISEKGMLVQRCLFLSVAPSTLFAKSLKVELPHFVSPGL